MKGTAIPSSEEVVDVDPKEQLSKPWLIYLGMRPLLFSFSSMGSPVSDVCKGLGKGGSEIGLVRWSWPLAANFSRLCF